MLDLNLGIISSDSSCDDNNNNNNSSSSCNMVIELENLAAEEASKTQMEEESGTSTSSIINAEEALTHPGGNNSSNNASTYIFAILKKENNDVDSTMSVSKGTNPGHNYFITHQLFPERTGPELKLEPGLVMPTTKRPQWSQLSQVESGGETELRIVQQKQQQVRKSRRGPRSRSSQYRGVTFYRRTGRWESHIWDCGKQVYLGGFDTAHAAARAYDRAAIKFRGVDADINFNLNDYDEDMKQMKNLNKGDFVQALRRQCTGFSRGTSKYKGAALRRSSGWDSRMGQFLGKNDYDKTTIERKGGDGIPIFQPGIYKRELFFDPNGGERCHNLDLSLGISVKPNDPSRNHHVADPHCLLAPCEIPRKVRPVFESTASTPMGMHAFHGLTISSKNLSTFSGIYPGTSSSYEAAEKRVEAISSRQFPSWPLIINGTTNVPAMPQIPVAASSGFASSTVSTAFPPKFLPKAHSHFNNSLRFITTPAASSTDAFL